MPGDCPGGGGGGAGWVVLELTGTLKRKSPSWLSELFTEGILFSGNASHFLRDLIKLSYVPSKLNSSKNSSLHSFHK